MNGRRHSRSRHGVQGGAGLFVALILAVQMLLAAPALAGQYQEVPTPAELDPVPEPDLDYDWNPTMEVLVGDTPWFRVRPAPSEGGVFGIEVSYSGKVLPNGKYEDGRIICVLEKVGTWGTSMCEGRSPRLGSPLDRHGPFWSHVVRLVCTPGVACASQTARRGYVRGAVGRTVMGIPNPHWKVKESHIERVPASAGGAGFAPGATMILSCRDHRFVGLPFSRDEGVAGEGDCRGSLTLRLVKPMTVRGVRLSTLGSVDFSVTAGGPREVRVALDADLGASRGGIARAVAVERALRAHGRLRVEISASWRDAAGRGRKFRGRAFLLAPTRLPYGCRTGCMR
jgi:hypothetical protein